MQRPPRHAAERVITGEMWRGIFFVGAVMVIGGVCAVYPTSVFDGVIDGCRLAALYSRREFGALAA